MVSQVEQNMTAIVKISNNQMRACTQRSVNVKVKCIREEAILPTELNELGMWNIYTPSCFDGGCHNDGEPFIREIRVPTGLAFDVPLGFHLQVEQCPVLAWKKGIVLIGSEFSECGELIVLLHRHVQREYGSRGDWYYPKLLNGTRIARVRVCESMGMDLEEVEAEKVDEATNE